MKKHPKKTPLPRQVKALGLVSFCNDMASEIVYPLLPAFVTQVLGLGPQVLGLMEGLAESLASLLKFFSGWWSDALKRRKPLAVAGYALASLLRPFIGFASAGWHLVALRSLDRVGKGLRTAPRDALLAASVDPTERGRAYGFHRAMDHAGAAVGPLIALGLVSGLGLDLRTVFFLTAVPGLITILVLLFAVREETTQTAKPSEKRSPQAIADKRTFGVFLFAMVLFTLGNSSDVFLVLHAHELGLPVALAPVLWFVLHLAKSLLSTPGGALSDRIGRKKAILLGWAVYALAYLGFALADQAWQIWPLFVLYALYYGLAEAPEKALTADLAPKHAQGKGFGLYHMSVGIAALPASALTGWIWETHGAALALAVGACFATLAALVFAIGFPSDSRPAPKQR